MSCSLIVAGIVSIFAILFAANQQTFGWAFNVAFWVLICYVALSLLIWLFYGILSLKDKPKKTLIFAVTIIVVLVASVLLSLGDSMPRRCSFATNLLKKRPNSSPSPAISPISPSAALSLCSFGLLFLNNLKSNTVLLYLHVKHALYKYHYGQKINSWLEYKLDVRYLVPVAGLLPHGLQHQLRYGYRT